MLDEYVDNIIAYNISGLDEGHYDVNATYNGDNDYITSFNSTSFNVYKEIMIIEADDILIDDTVTIDVNLPANAKGNVTVILSNGDIFELPLSNGHASKSVSGLAVGTYHITGIFYGDERYGRIINASSFDVNKKPVSMIPNATSVTLGKDVIVNVTLNGDGSHPITGIVLFEVGGDSYYANVTNGIASITVKGLKVGNYEAFINYTGNARYLDNHTVVGFEVTKISDYNIDVDSEVSIRIGDNNNIVITLPSDINDGTLTVNINGSISTPNIVNGVANVEYTGLIAGNYMINVTYSGNENYSAGENNGTTFVVTRNDNYLIGLTATDIIYNETEVVITVTLPDGANAQNLTIRVNDTTYTRDDFTVLGNVVSLRIGDIAAGDYTVTATYNADYGYDTKSNVTVFNVAKANSTIDIDVKDVYIYNETIVVEFITTGSNGTINVTINGKVYRVDNNNQIVIENITASDYTIIANLAADENYTAATNSTTFKVIKAGTSVEIGVESIYKVGENIEISLTTVNVTDLTVTINGRPYVVEDGKVIITGGLEAGDYIVNAVLSENENYTGSSDTKSFNVVKNNITISVNDTTVPVTIVVGTPVIFTANLNETVTGDVIFNINGANYTVHISNANNATYEYTPVNNDVITVVATFAGNDKYNGNVSDEKSFNVNRIATNITLEINKNPINVGDSAIITIKLNESITAVVKLNISGDVKDVAVVNGVGTYTVSGLANGTYSINATYAGDDYYVGNNSNVLTLTVNKIPTDVVVSLDDDSIFVGEDAVINIGMTPSINGTVMVKVNGRDYAVAVVDGKGKLVLSNLVNDTYVINATFAETGQYIGKLSNTVTLAVNKKFTNITLTIDKDVISGNDSAVVTIKLNESITAVVKLNISGDVKDVAVVNGVGTYTVSGLANGTYSINATYAGDDYYVGNNSNVLTLTVNKIPTDVVVSLDDDSIFVGEDAVINIGMTPSINGTVMVKVNGRDYAVAVVDGKGKLVLSNLVNDTYVINATFAETGQYVGKVSNTVILEVNKKLTNISVEVTTPVNVGELPVIKVKLNESINTTVKLRIGEDIYDVAIVNGQGTYTAFGLANGTYSINATYAGDDYYVGSTSDIKSLEVNKIPTDVVVSLDDDSIFAGEDAVINVEIAPTINATVIVKVNGDIKDVAVVDGKGKLVLSNLANDTYTINATFAETGQYVGKVSNTVTLSVYKMPTKINITVETPVTYGEDAVITIELNTTGNSTVKLNIGGKEYDVAIVNGKGKFNASGLTSGIHEVNVTYDGDGKYVGSIGSTTFIVDNATLSAEVTALNVTVEQNTTFGIGVTDKFNGNVSIKVGEDVLYNGTVKSMIDAAKLPAGDYVATVEFYGDSNYDVATSVVEFTVSRVTPEINVNIEDVTYPGKAIAEITMSNGANGTVRVTVGGKVFEGNVSDGVGSVELTGLSAGNKEATVEFTATDKYNNNVDASSGFIVYPNNSLINIPAHSEVYTVGQDIEIEFVSVNSTGDIVISINGVYNTRLYPNPGANSVSFDNLTEGTYIITAVLEGDQNYTGYTTTTAFKVVKNNVTISVDDITAPDVIVVDSPVTFTARLSENVTGDVIFTINDANYTVHIVDSDVAIYEYTPVNNETLTVVATFAGNDKYNGNVSDEKQFAVDRIVTGIDVTVETPVTYGEDAIITVVLDAGIDTIVKLSVDGEVYDVALVNGKGKFNASGLTSGIHEVNVTYDGDGKYVGSVGSTTFAVDNATLSVEVTALNVTVEQNTTFGIGVTDKFDGNVSIKVGDDVLYNGTVKSMIDAAKLPAGDYVATVVFYGDSNYDVATSVVEFTVSRVTSDITVIIGDVTYPDTAVAVITMSNGANGTVNITVDGKVFEGIVSSGVGSIELSGLSAGSKFAYVEFFTSDAYNDNATASAKFNVNKADSTLAISVNDIYVYNDIIAINLTTAGSEGAINVTINGKSYDVTDNQVVIESIVASDYTIIADLAASENYTSASNSTTFKVIKAATSVEISIESVHKVGDNVVITLNTVNETDLTVTVNGEVKDVAADNTIIIANAEAGDYIVNAIIKGNENYTGSNDTESFTVNKVVPDVTVINVTVVDGHDAVIEVTGPSDIDANIVVSVGGSDYAVNMTDGIASLTVKGLDIGNNKVTVTYLENDKYVDVTSDGWVNVTAKGLSAVVIDVEDVYVVDSNVVITVTPFNSTGGLTVTINGKEYGLDEDGKITIDKAVNGTYEIVAVLAEDANYYGSNSTATFKVNKLTPEISVSDVVVIDGRDAVINIAGPADRTGGIVVEVDGSKYYATMTDGEAEVTVSGLAVGDYSVSVTYLENDKYVESSADANISVTAKGLSAVVIDVNDVYDVDDTVVITVTSVNSTGGLSVTINGKEYGLDEDGKITIDKAVNGTYEIVAVLAEDANYYGSNSTATFEVNKVTPSISATDAVITVGKDAVITVTGPADRTGGIVVEVDGSKYYATMTDGEAEVIIKNLATGEYSVKVKYLENDKYVEADADASVSVNSKIDSVMDVTIDVGSNNNATVTVELPENATGNITVVVDGKEYNVTDLINGTAVIKVGDLSYGNHTIDVIYSGDENYTDASKSTDIEVPQVSDYELTVDAVVDISSVDITVTLPDDIDGVVLINVGEEGYYANATNGQAKLHLGGLSNGLYDVTVTYPGDDKYASGSNSTSFVIDAKVTPDMDIVVDIPENATTGTITVTLPENATGNITVVIDGKEYAVANLTNGTAVIEVKDLAAGNHTAEVIYSGDDHYNGITNYTNVEIPRISDYKFDVIAADIISGELLNIEVILPEDVDGVVLVDIGGKGYYINVTGGRGSVDISGLSPGDYSVVVTYPGDDYYDSKSNSTTVSVKAKQDPVMSVDICVENGTVTVELPEDATGNVTVVIDGNVYNVTEVINGTAVVYITDVLPGNHSVEVIYSGDDTYTDDSYTDDIEVPKVSDYSFNVTAGSDLDVVSVAVELPEDVDGVVLVDIGGKGYYINVTGGRGSVDISGLSPGDYSVVVTYPGDDYYDSKSNSTTVSVKAKETPDIKVDVDPTNGTIAVELPENATGNVTILIDGQNVTGEVINNTIIVNITDVLPGNHSVEVIYSGDDNYTPYYNSTDFEVPKLDNSLNVTVNVKNNNATISVELPDDINGIVLVDVNDKGYYVEVTNGKGLIELSDLDNGNYSVVVYYPGDSIYDAIENTTSFNINYTSIFTPIVIAAPDIFVGENLTVMVIVPSDASGDVIINIDGRNFTSSVSKGIAKFVVPDLSADVYVINATYDGDDKYDANTTSAIVKVSKISDYPLYVTNDVKKITVHLPEDAKGNVTLIIHNDTFTGEVINGTVTIYDPNLTSGYHNITVVYGGDDKYASKEVNMSINVNNVVIIDAPIVTKYYSGPERFYVYLEDLGGNKISNASVSITINGITYNKTTDENGMASLAIRLNSGNYSVYVTFNGNEEFDSVHAASAVVVRPTIYASDVTKIFRNGTQYYALFLDGEGNPLVNTTVSFNIHGVFYNRTTDDSGWAKLNLNLEKGTYILTAINPVTGEMRTNIVEIISQIVENHDLIKEYLNDSQFTVRILADSGSPAGAGELVTFNIHGMIYSKYTNDDGYATLDINLLPGDYIITTYYEECREGNHIIVLPTESVKEEQ